MGKPQVRSKDCNLDVILNASTYPSTIIDRNISRLVGRSAKLSLSQWGCADYPRMRFPTRSLGNPCNFHLVNSLRRVLA